MYTPGVNDVLLRLMDLSCPRKQSDDRKCLSDGVVFGYLDSRVDILPASLSIGGVTII